MSELPSSQIRLTSQHLFVLQHAAQVLIEGQRQLHWSIVALMGKEPDERAAVLKMTERLAEQIAQAEDAIVTVSRIYESQFK